MSTGIVINGGSGGGAAANYKAVIAWDGNSVPVVADIPAGVVVTYQGTNYTGTLSASSATKKYVYLVKAGSAPDAYDEYKTYQNIADGTWFWDKVGSCRIDLTPYRTAEAQDAIDEALAASIAPERTLAEYMAVLVRRVETLEGIINAGNLGNVKVDSIIIRDGITRYGSVGNEHLTGSGAPTVIPDHRGQKYYDLTGGHIYEAIDNTAVSNWKMTV